MESTISFCWIYIHKLISICVLEKNALAKWVLYGRKEHAYDMSSISLLFPRIIKIFSEILNKKNAKIKQDHGMDRFIWWENRYNSFLHKTNTIEFAEIMVWKKNRTKHRNSIVCIFRRSIRIQVHLMRINPTSPSWRFIKCLIGIQT